MTDNLVSVALSRCLRAGYLPAPLPFDHDATLTLGACYSMRAPFDFWSYRIRHPYYVHGTNRYLLVAMGSFAAHLGHRAGLPKPDTR